MGAQLLEANDDGDNYFRVGASEAEIYANGARAWPEIEIREALVGTQGLGTFARGKRLSAGITTGHLLLHQAMPTRVPQSSKDFGSEVFLG